jgi:hypothetical protein
MKFNTQQNQANANSMLSNPKTLDQSLRKVHQFIEDHQYELALAMTKGHEHSDVRLRNAKGVCLLRLGRFKEALHLFRSLTIDERTLTTKPKLPTEVITNFATVLLLQGHLGGCMERLHDVTDQHHPAVQRLFSAVAKWKAGLTFFQRIYWRLTTAEPVLELDFEPGDLCPDTTALKTEPTKLRCEEVHV